MNQTAKTVELPIIDLASSDRISTAQSIRQACIECGFFYLINHGVEENLLQKVFEGSKEFFSLPLEEKIKLARKDHRGYTPLYAERLDASLNLKGDSKESFYVGPLEDRTPQGYLMNQWPSDEVLPSWRSTVEDYYRQVLNAADRLISLVALALNLEEKFFHNVGAWSPPYALLRLIHYPGEVDSSSEETFGASAHSDYGMITLLASNGVCRDKFNKPRVWEDVQHIPGAFIVNIGDLMERWTNLLFRSTLHRVMPVGQERYSVALFTDPNPNCVVECLKTCCNESTPPRYGQLCSEILVAG
ncbi:Iron/ascorbate family oxidoreductase [Handroanthus impetiginosus]|uniref:Iron/ascorbate family oxidoreductase n=1 Tax=Handroanthus impetiginosus TaxID=429701 RepID=A0A2G9H764_9LAMI|nr:Iron/ascorbate family oxidoreductase [Handroanthus impetiginosus]